MFLAENVLSTQMAPKAGYRGTRLPFKQLKRLRQDSFCPQVQHVWRGGTLSLQSKARVSLGISEGIVALVKRHDCRASSCNHYFVHFPREGSIHPVICGQISVGNGGQIPTLPKAMRKRNTLQGDAD